jgi:glycosyltransferase involved in cell wall biosynthesis
MPEVSFVVIAYNEERSIGRCLASIEALEGIESSEIIVVDDGSKDRTLAIVHEHAAKDARVRAVPLERNQGRGAARAAGVKAARGASIAFVDADIVLPKNWYTTCKPYLNEYDAVGGIATPDADVNYVYTLLDLPAKVLPHTIAVSGSNSLYRRDVFDTVSFDGRLREGEDVVLGQSLEKTGKKVRSIKELVVEHRETKSFAHSVRWLYQMGLGASRQLKQIKEIRLPDIAVLGFVFSICAAGAGWWLTGFAASLLLVPLFVVGTAAMHIYTRFYIRLAEFWKYPIAIAVQSVLISAYYLGRCVGMVTMRVPKEPA